jgi:ribosomal-protein-alanine N-acetyltransferase
LSITIREAGPADADVILDIDRAFSRVFAQAASYERLVEQNGVVLLVALAEKICGFAACSRVLDEATLLNFVVVPEARSQGVARQLLDMLIGLLADMGVARLLLEVRESNVIAQTLYLSAGFTRDGQRAHYYPTQDGGAAETAVLMSRQLEIQIAST